MARCEHPAARPVRIVFRSRSWWLGVGAGLPPGPLWLWASPASGALWPWCLALLGLRARVRRFWGWALPRVRNRRARWRHWWRLAPPLLRRLWFRWLPALMAVLLAPLMGLLGLWVSSRVLPWLVARGVIPAGGAAW